MNRFICASLMIVSMILNSYALNNNAQNMDNPNTNKSLAPVEQLQLTQEWDKTFPRSEKVDHHKVTFVNRYGVTLAADMYKPKNAEGKLPAIAISGPFGAVKEQSSGLYAQQLAERRFLTIAFDPSFTGESGGMPRRVASPDINTKDFFRHKADSMTRYWQSNSCQIPLCLFRKAVSFRHCL